MHEGETGCDIKTDPYYANIEGNENRALEDRLSFLRQKTRTVAKAKSAEGMGAAVSERPNALKQRAGVP
jgi:hypothetical protein